ncbi:hypothetical protein B4125_1541 [Bacillus paralicheniformis]|jgi:hypothetical protein|nr:hypothetical protein LI6934_14295 [Bacillus licheniformis LMG 6934]OLG07360.1 hypothetical protein B4125_1541 [Bacillus paralicheniformis]TWJ62304.1 hypothetical protein CHCC5021_1771 [Bacillus paralicheniformis]TWJ80515.1 hypothetical protein CHCC5019_0091 [Bacillus paralicheniformis]TWL09452.1 hypothetical protein CHCC19468_1663 [Bacillus paralicheniformis]
MKSKLLICAVLLLGFTGVAASSYIHTENDSYDVAIRIET